MFVINFSNVQEIIFSDVEVQNKLPEFKELFQQWKMGQFAPSLRPMAQKALLDLLNQLGDEQVRTLELHFGTSIKVEKLDYTLVKNHELPIMEAQELINYLDIFREVFLHRDANYLYISTWR